MPRCARPASWALAPVECRFVSRTEQARRMQALLAPGASQQLVLAPTQHRPHAEVDSSPWPIRGAHARHPQKRQAGASSPRRLSRSGSLLAAGRRLRGWSSLNFQIRLLSSFWMKVAMQCNRSSKPRQRRGSRWHGGVVGRRAFTSCASWRPLPALPSPHRTKGAPGEVGGQGATVGEGRSAGWRAHGGKRAPSHAKKLWQQGPSPSFLPALCRPRAGVNRQAEFACGGEAARAHALPSRAARIGSSCDRLSHAKLPSGRAQPLRLRRLEHTKPAGVSLQAMPWFAAHRRTCRSRA